MISLLAPWDDCLAVGGIMTQSLAFTAGSSRFLNRRHAMTRTRARTGQQPFPLHALHLAALAMLLVFATVAAHAQVNLRVRGTITAFDGNVLSVKTREGKDLQLRLGEKAVVVAAKAMKLEDLKAGDYVGTTTKAGPGGALVAVEVHTLSPTTPQGHIPWDLQEGSMMTNGNVGTVVQSAGAQQLSLEYKGGSQKIVVPPGTPVVTNTPADRSALKPGEYVFTTAQVAADGTMIVQRIQVSKDGVKPPQ
jgi:hypothetical protein